LPFLLAAVTILIWILLETTKMKKSIERLLDANLKTDVQAIDVVEQVSDKPSDQDVTNEAMAESPVTDASPNGNDIRDSWPAGKKLISKLDRDLLARIDDEIESNLQDSEYSIEMLRTTLGISRSGLYKKLIFLTGKSPLEYIRVKRLQKGRDLLESGETTVSQIAWSVGFSPKQFSKYFKHEYGCLPSEYIHHLTD